MPEQLLDGSDIMAVLQEMSREGVPEGMGATTLGDTRLPDRILHNAVEHGLVQVVASALARDPITISTRGGRDPLPGPRVASMRILPEQRGRQLDPARAHGQILVVLRPDIFQPPDEGGLGHSRQHRDPNLVALATTDNDLIGGEVDVLHTEPAALEHPQIGAVEQARHEAGCALEALT